ncbi:MAG: MOSC domain-containing protein [Vicinamibacterales bacterium]
MRLLSLNTGLPREIEWRGDVVLTSIFKTPVTGRRWASRLNLDGDKQADLTVHGGVNKAVYVYPSEHYAFWHRELPGTDLPPGAFGENLTTEGLLEGGVQIGDQLRIGSTEFVVTQPRMPCYKLGVRFDRPDMVKRFLRSGRSGFYLAVVREGDIGAADSITRIASGPPGISVAEVVALSAADDPDRSRLRLASELPTLAESWRERLRQRLARLDAESD